MRLKNLTVAQLRQAVSIKEKIKMLQTELSRLAKGGMDKGMSQPTRKEVLESYGGAMNALVWSKKASCWIRPKSCWVIIAKRPSER